MVVMFVDRFQHMNKRCDREEVSLLRIQLKAGIQMKSHLFSEVGRE